METEQTIATVRQILSDTIMLPAATEIEASDFLDVLGMNEWDRREALFDAFDAAFGTSTIKKRLYVLTYGDLLALVNVAL